MAGLPDLGRSAADAPSEGPDTGATVDERTADSAVADRRLAPDEPAAPALWRRPSTMIAAVSVLVVGLIAVTTTYVPIDDESLVVVDSFDTENYGPETFPEVAAEIERTAVDVPQLLEALQENEEDANERFGQQAGTGPYSFPVRGTGVAGTAEGGKLPVEIDGVDEEFTIQIQVGPVLTGTALRDAVAIIDFDQFLNQMDYAAAARALNDEVKEQVLAQLDAEDLAGSEISFVGAFTRDPGTTVTITPVALEATP
jgi:predicted lipoprotein